MTPSEPRRTSLASTHAGAWILVLCWALIILVLILQPGAEDLGQRRWRITVTSIGHAAFFGALAVLVAHALFRHGARRTVWWACVLTILFGIACEVVQVQIPGRSASVVDLAADMVGAWAGAVAFTYVAARHPEFRVTRPGPAPRAPARVTMAPSDHA